MARQLQDELILTLRAPITLGTGLEAQTYTELSLREPLVDEVLDFNKRSARDPGDALRVLIAKISGAPLAVISKMRARDFTRASGYLMDFLNPEIEDAGGDDTPGK